MLGGIVERNRLIVVSSSFQDVSRTQQGSAQHAMPYHKRDCRSLLLGQRQELRRKITQSVTVERHVVCSKETVQDREQQQRIFGRLAERFGLFDQ
jgi:hypothetical protein